MIVVTGAPDHFLDLRARRFLLRHFFGSHARGEQTRESDLDLLVVMPVTGSRRRQAATIELALVGVDMPTDVIVATPDEVARLKGVPGSIIKPALQERRAVYERPA